jgi:putative addiction module CopG family antidote
MAGTGRLEVFRGRSQIRPTSPSNRNVVAPLPGFQGRDPWILTETHGNLGPRLVPAFLPEFTMAKPLPLELETFLADAIRSGKYRSRDEVIQTALRLLRERERKQEALSEDIQQGLAELDAGQGIELDGPAAVDTFFDDIKANGRAGVSK